MAALRKRVLVLSAVALCVVATCLVDFFFHRSYRVMPGRSYNRGMNGLWLRYTWYFGKRTDADLNAAVEAMKRREIARAYFHVREVTRDGRLVEHNEIWGRKINDTMHRVHPSAKSIAWIALGDYYPSHGTDIQLEQVRKRVATECAWLTTVAGFDGVQIDYEPCKNGDANLLSLLQEVRKSIGPSKYLSVATFMWMEPPVFVTWTREYFAEVAQRCDEIAVMAYDSHLPHPRLYEWFVEKQVEMIVPTVAKANARCGVMVGLPAYDREFMHDHCETLWLGLAGVRRGMEHISSADAQAFEGIGIFADYTTDAAEWHEYEQFWLQQ